MKMTSINFEWFQSTVISLSNDELDKTSVLSELKLALGNLNASQMKLIVNSLPLEQIFDCLNSSQRDQVALTCDVLSLLLSTTEPGVVLGKYEAALHRALGHPFACVKDVAIKQLHRAISDERLVEKLIQEGGLILAVIECVNSEDIAVANNAVNLLVKLGETPGGLRLLYSAPCLNALKDLMMQKDVIRFRVYEIVVDVAAISENSLQASRASGLLSSLLSELQGNDVLLQMNALELLTKLALCEHGLLYLEEHNVLKFLVEKLSSVADDPLSSILLPGIIRFFGNIAQSRPKEVFTQYPGLVQALFETLDTSDFTLLGVAMETIGYIATSVQGKYMLQSLGSIMNEALKKLAQKIKNCPTEWRVCALNTVANLLDIKPEEQDTQSLAVTKGWFEQLAPDPVELIMSICRQPFFELRIAGLQVLKVLAAQPWGQEYIFRTAGLVEFLLDRTVEASKLCKDAKFEVVKTIVESPTSESIFDAATMLRLTEHLREGPFYVEAKTEVAIEGAS